MDATTTAEDTGLKAGVVPGLVREELKAERIQAALRELPGWALTAEGTALSRTFQVTVPASRPLVAFAGYVAELARYHGVEADLDVHLGGVTVTLSSRAGGGLTEGEVELAKTLQG